MIAGEVVGLDAVVEIVVVALAEQAQRPAEDLVGGAVVDPELLGASDDVDADLAQRGAPVVDPLMAVADDEHVVRLLVDRCTQQTPLRLVEILRFVDDHVAIRLHAARRK